MVKKLTSRKFWISVAALLGSVATSIAGFNNENKTLTTIGIICATISAAVYTICEASVDKSNRE